VVIFFFISLLSPFGVNAKTYFNLLFIDVELNDVPLLPARGVIVVSFFEIIFDSFVLWFIAYTLFSLCSEMFFDTTGVKFLFYLIYVFFSCCSYKNDRLLSF